MSSLERDPGMRKPIWEHPLSEQDRISREYILAGPFQPMQQFPLKQFGTRSRRFQYDWFELHPWLEYSNKDNFAFCFPCYLFTKSSHKNLTFVTKGASNWKKVGGKDCIFSLHAGGANSFHSQRMEAWRPLPDKQHSIEVMLNRQCQQQVKDNVQRLTASIDVVRFLTNQGLAFRGHDEHENSFNRGNFLELLASLSQRSQDFANVCLDRAPRNCQLTSPKVQKDIVSVMANDVRQRIVQEIGDGHFCVLVHEA
jgi:hypothetical protein